MTLIMQETSQDQLLEMLTNCANRILCSSLSSNIFSSWLQNLTTLPHYSEHSCCKDAHMLSVCAVLGAVMAATVAWFSSIDKLAALLLLPHLGWTVFATVLVNSLNTDHQQVSMAQWFFACHACPVSESQPRSAPGHATCACQHSTTCRGYLSSLAFIRMHMAVASSCQRPGT